MDLFKIYHKLTDDPNITMLKQSSADECECPNHLMVALAAFLSSTLEIWLRAFALGFGAHMLSFLFIEKRDADLEDIKKRAPVSLVSGLAVACLVFGSAFFVPTQFRINWLDYDN